MSAEELLSMDKEELVSMLEQTAQLLETSKANQKGLVEENNSLRTKATKASSGKLIFAKMLAIKKEIGSIGKDQKNTFQGFKFRGIDQFINQLHPILNKHGVGVTTKVLNHAEEYKTNDKGKTSKNVRLVMEYTFFAEDGSTISCQMPSEGVDTSDKATNKALSAALKYCLIQTFFVPTEDMAEADFDSTQIDGTELKSKAGSVVAKKANVGPTKKSFRRKPKTVVKEASNDIEL